MVLLEKSHYDKVIVPLQSVCINNLFARSVVEHKVSGKIYVDNINNPKVFYVVHPYGMSLLFGDYSNSDFNNHFKEYGLNLNKIRTNYEWVQVFPDEWNDTLINLFGNNLVKSAYNTIEAGIIELNTRVNFKFSHEKYLNREIKNIQNIKIVKTDKNIFENMHGSVIPKYFWDNVNDFLENGIGFSLLFNKQLAATAFSSYIHDDKYELGVETVAEFRKKGFAEIISSVLIDYCIESNYEPVWSCRFENTGSYMLAQKIGFMPIMKKPYYRLSK